jgi:hypothetical protein
MDMVFGYGSLVHRGTHAMRAISPATLEGWERVWVRTGGRRAAFLSVRRAPAVVIEGLLLEVRDTEWVALDRREAAYRREVVRVRPAEADTVTAQVYVVPEPQAEPPSAEHPILLSYLLTVASGFAAEFGPEAIARFFATTSGWQGAILDDSAAPAYPRACPADPEVVCAVREGIARVGARVRRSPS